ncbi:MAG: S-layer homology domain-containing protein [Candidatus Gastranaerophilales bacterium]|nr:S-layer homology domain-containing protein [Candidatus Gastranaerophilales bacterium]
MSIRNFRLKIICLALLFTLINVNLSYGIDYDDVPQGFWAYAAINGLSQEGILFGYPDNMFQPEKYVTRAEYASMTVRALNQQNSVIDTMYSFEDISPSDWGWNYVIRAVNLDIIKPSDDGYFYPDDYITKTEIITFLVNILKTEDITDKEALTALQNNYKNYSDIPDWFKVTAGKAEFMNLIPKTPENAGTLEWDSPVTRAELAVFLYNMKKETDSYIQQKKIEETSPKIGEGIIIDNVIINEDIATLPAQTVLPVTIIGQLSSKDAYPGQMFQAKFVNNIVDYEHHIILSKDIILTGKILDSSKARYILNNGELIFELSCVNKNNLLTRIMGVAEYEAEIIEANKVKKVFKTIIKGQNFTAKDGQILYIRLFKPLRVNIVTGEVID